MRNCSKSRKSAYPKTGNEGSTAERSETDDQREPEGSARMGASKYTKDTKKRNLREKCTFPQNGESSKKRKCFSFRAFRVFRGRLNPFLGSCTKGAPGSRRATCLSGPANVACCNLRRSFLFRSRKRTCELRRVARISFEYEGRVREPAPDHTKARPAPFLPFALSGGEAERSPLL
jgi:hypothetical protein